MMMMRLMMTKPVVLLLAVMALDSQAFMPPAARQGLHSQTRLSAHEGDHSTHQESIASASSIDRQGFLNTIGLMSTAGVMASTLRTTSPASAIGQLPEWKDDKHFLQHLVINVPDMAAALTFYIDGLQMEVLRSRIVGGVNSTFVGYGPESLATRSDFYPGVSSLNVYGAHFALELNEVKPNEKGDVPILDPGNQIAYLHIAVPSLRISKLIQAGGNIRSAYGWVFVDSPGGLLHQVIVGLRRDPIMFLALECPGVKKSQAFYKNVLGMRELEYPLSRAPESVYEPKKPKGSVFLGYNPDGFGILLLPTKTGTIVRTGGVVDKLAIIDTDVIGQGEKLKAKFAGEAPGIGTRVAVTNDPDGLGIVLVEYEDLEKELI